MNILYLLLAIGVLFVVVYVVMKQKAERLIDEGKMVKRGDEFYDKEHFFTVRNAPWDVVVKKASAYDIPEAKVSVFPNNGGRKEILYKSKHSWNAVLSQVEEKEDHTIYRFEFSAYITSGSFRIPDTFSMNIMQTAIEKMFLEIDPQAKVESHEIRRKTKTL